MKNTLKILSLILASAFSLNSFGQSVLVHGEYRLPHKSTSLMGDKLKTYNDPHTIFLKANEGSTEYTTSIVFKKDDGGATILEGSGTPALKKIKMAQNDGSIIETFVKVLSIITKDGDYLATLQFSDEGKFAQITKSAVDELPIINEVFSASSPSIISEDNPLFKTEDDFTFFEQRGDFCKVYTNNMCVLTVKWVNQLQCYKKMIEKKNQ